MSAWIAGLGLLAAAWLALCIWTARRLLFRADPAARRAVLRYGLPLWLGLAVVNWIGGLDGRPLAARTLASLAIAFPFSMWMGHFFDRMFSRPPEGRPGRSGR
ncbi:MAG TPA: hypothetical protein VF615_26200 [Longimicrobiaceae bacterium]